MSNKKENSSLSQDPMFIINVQETLIQCKEVYFGGKEQSRIEQTLKELFKVLIDFHYSELERQIEFYESLTTKFKEEKTNPQIWEIVLMVSEAYIKEAVDSSVQIVLGKLSQAIDTKYYPAQGKANAAKIKRLAKYAKYLKKLPVIKIVSVMTDILNINAKISEKLELARKNRQAESVLDFSKFITGLRSNMNSKKLNNMRSFLVEIHKSSNGSELAYFSLLTQIEYMTLKSSGVDVYKKFDQTIINGIFNSFKIEITIEYVRDATFKITEYGKYKRIDKFRFESISFSNDSILPLYKALSASNFTLYEIVFSETSFRPVLPSVILKVSWPWVSKRLTIKLNPNYMRNYLFSDGAYYLRPNDLAHFRTYLTKNILPRGMSFEKEYYFTTPLIFSKIRLSKLLPSESGLKFKNENNSPLIDLE